MEGVPNLRLMICVGTKRASFEAKAGGRGEILALPTTPAPSYG